MKVNQRYEAQQAQAILAAYRRMFPERTKTLADYWDLDRHKQWGGLTTDFWRVSYDDIAQFHDRYTAAIPSERDTMGVGEALAAYAQAGPVGFAIGISPWTDHLLLTTYRPGADVLIVLGHDWYPIVMRGDDPADDYMAAPPLTPSAPKDDYPYALGEATNTVLFLNLYPHFREPGVEPTGRIRGANYKSCVRGVRAVCQALSDSGHTIRGVIGWGGVVWEELGWGHDSSWRINVSSAWARAADEGPLPLDLGGQRVPFFPFLHPSFGPFRSRTHFEAYHRIWKQLATEKR